MTSTPSVPHPGLHTAACELFGVEVPVVQTGMGWVSGARLTAATSAAGGLGILASATMSLDELAVAIDKVRARTPKPFGVNLLPSQPDAMDRIALLAEMRVPVASFAAAPAVDQVDALHDAGVATVVTVGAPRHAQKMAAMGVRAVIAQGAEGGGHTGTVPTALLIPGVLRAVEGGDMVVLVAGGMRDGAGLAASLAWGAHGIAMGTRFLLTAESHVPDHVKDVYLAADLGSTVVTTAIDGAPQRVIRTPFVERLESSRGPGRLARAGLNAVRFARRSGISLGGLLHTARAMHDTTEMTWSQVAMAANAPMMTRASVVDGDLDAGILPTGQVVGVIDDLPTVAELLDGIVEEATVALRRVCADGGASGAPAGPASSPGPSGPS